MQAKHREFICIQKPEQSAYTPDFFDGLYQAVLCSLEKRGLLTAEEVRQCRKLLERHDS